MKNLNKSLVIPFWYLCEKQRKRDEEQLTYLSLLFI